MTILNNTDFSFNYSTLINDPNVNNAGTNGEYDFENANLALQYTIPEADKTYDWFTGYRFERIDNDNDFFSGVSLNEGSKKVNRFAIRTSLGHFGYQEGEEIDTFTSGNTKSISNFYYKVRTNKTYYLGNNMVIKPGFKILFDSDSDGYIQINLDLEKFLGKSNNFVGIGNNTSYTVNLGNSNATDIESYLKTDFYVEGSINKFLGNVSYNLGQLKFKGPNVETTKNPKGLSFGLARYNDKETPLNTDMKTPLNTDMKLGWQ